MPDQDSSAKSTGSAFEIVTPSKSKKVSAKSIIVIIAVFLFLGVAVFLGVYLVQQRQNIQEKAAGSQCPAAEACPYSGDTSLLRSCHPADTDGTVVESRCDRAGRVETCGSATTKYCCPVAGAAWTTNMSVCNSLAAATVKPSPTASPTATASPTSTIAPLVTQSSVTASPSATPTASATGTSSPVPIPVTGVEWPTVLGIGVGVITIVGSILLAL